ncbi:MAG: DUF4350 domain-containing protein [Candidatus Thiodiazotropha sp. (ex Dulcina madagascariensis)]|nr:DUF4350 domain-containing protein [Candidatus Thiodiazotropha sp. (ex Dulcina madagascariensis)]MCU7925547.1 DUF4350 domain-containing protein [Candidatus Thiodiazotropha sp. (ex Dulcina madagascariensis)]
MRNRPLAIAAMTLLSMLLIGFLAVWFEKNFERRIEEVRTAMQPEARRNPLLAAERFLSRLGVDVESRSGRHYLTTPPDRLGMLFVRDLGPPLPQSRVTELLAWVERGGDLLATPSSQLQDGSSHPLLAHYGISVESGESDEEEGAATLFLPDDETSMQIGFDTAKWFEIDTEHAYLALPDEEYPQLLIFPRGEGRVIFLSDNDFFSNQRIDQRDHALLLARLVADNDRVWLLYSSQMPSLIALLWRHAPYLLISLALLGLLLVWRLTRRTGPLITPAPAQRRDLLEHLQAVAEFAWRHDPAKGLLEGARRQVEHRWLASHPSLHHLDRQARCHWLAERTGMTAGSIHQALYPDQGDTGRLIKTTANLQRLLAALHPERKKK